MKVKLRLFIALLTFALVAAMPLSQAWASGDLDEILAYDITVDVNEDATLTMVYHIEWKVLDSTSDGPLTWVRVGIPNKHYNERTSSDCSMAFLARSIPIFSTLSSVSLIPAVSVRRSCTPRTLTLTSRVSRVVPAISVTIARSVPAR